MSRIRLSKNGIDIAKPGFDVETATVAQMAFSSSAVAARVALRGTVSVSAFSGYMDDVYYRGTVNFGFSFPEPPVVLVAGALSGGSSEQGPMQISGAATVGDAYIMPFYSIETYIDHFDLFVLQQTPGGGGVAQGPGTNTWRYWVLANTLQS